MSNQDRQQEGSVLNEEIPELVLGPGAPNLHLDMDRNYHPSRGILLDPKYIIKSSCLRCMFHFVIITLFLVMYTKEWCFLQKSDAVETFSPEYQSQQALLSTTQGAEENIELDNSVQDDIPSPVFMRHTNDFQGTFVRSYLLLHMLNGVLNGAFVVIVFQTPRILSVVYSCKMVLCKMVLIFTLLIICLQSAQLGKTLKTIENNPNYQNKFEVQIYKGTTFGILGTELVHVFIQAIFLYHYGYLYRKQLFPERYGGRRNELDGTIYDYDPDQGQDIEQVPAYINRYPPNYQDYTENIYEYQKQVTEYIATLKTIKITRQIIMSNLKPRKNKKKDESQIQGPQSHIKSQSKVHMAKKVLKDESMESEQSEYSQVADQKAKNKVYRPTDSPVSVNMLDIIIQSPEKQKKEHEHKLTKQEYRKLLQDYEEIEDMCCPICLDQIEQDQMMVKTNCGQDANTETQSNMNRYFPQQETNSVQVGSVQIDDKSSQKSTCKNLLKGHKFHLDCFKDWLQRGQFHVGQGSNIYNRCPLCRQDIIQLQGSRRDLQSTVVASNVGPSSSIQNPNGSPLHPQSTQSLQQQLRSRSFGNQDSHSNNFDIYSVGHSLFNGRRRNNQPDQMSVQMQNMQRDTLAQLQQYQYNRQTGRIREESMQNIPVGGSALIVSQAQIQHNDDNNSQIFAQNSQNVHQVVRFADEDEIIPPVDQTNRIQEVIVENVEDDQQIEQMNQIRQSSQVDSLVNIQEEPAREDIEN